MSKNSCFFDLVRKTAVLLAHESIKYVIETQKKGDIPPPPLFQVREYSDYVNPQKPPCLVCQPTFWCAGQLRTHRKNHETH